MTEADRYASGAPPEDPYATVSPPASTDGPQEPVDWTELEEDAHPAIPPEEADLDADAGDD
jgi:hypothetical protein